MIELLNIFVTQIDSQLVINKNMAWNCLLVCISTFCFSTLLNGIYKKYHSGKKNVAVAVCVPLKSIIYLAAFFPQYFYLFLYTFFSKKIIKSKNIQKLLNFCT